MKSDLSVEAIRLCRLLLELLPDAEVRGLLALMLLHESRRAARSSDAGDLILLNEQDRTLWDRELIAEGSALISTSLRSQQFGAYTLQAAIVAVHADAATPEDTDWAEIVGLYDLLMRIHPSPVVELNRAVAVAMRDGPQAGLDIVDQLLRSGVLGDYHLAWSARADLHRRLDRRELAIADYREALRRVKQEPERRFLERRLVELGA